MLTHVVFFKWRPETTEDQIRAFEDGLAALPPQIPEIKSYRFGRDARLEAGEWDFVLIGEFENEAAWERYDSHPAHERFKAECARPMIGARAAVQTKD